MSGVSKEHRAAQAWDDIEFDLKSRLPKLLKKNLDIIADMLDDDKLSDSNKIRTAEFLIKLKNEMKKEELEEHGGRKPVVEDKPVKLAPIISLKAQ